MSESPKPTSPRRKIRPPRWMIAVAIVLIVASWIPLVLIARGRVDTSTEPRYQFMLDMAKQPRYRTQTASDFFADGREMRPVVPGTVARGQLEDDDHYYRGFIVRRTDATTRPTIEFCQGMPSRVKMSADLLKRGQQRFDIYCAPCHGMDGYGKGPVNQRALELQEGTWTQAASLHDPTPRGRPDGHIFNTITHGIRNMPGYGGQIPVEDRWAIIAYVRALQLSQNPPPGVKVAKGGSQ